jgi:hypothetical protein
VSPPGRAGCGGPLLSLLLSGTSLIGSNAFVSIDVSRPGPPIDPNLYGIFLEEVNHGVDGGLYAELIRNRAFEDPRPPEGYTFRDGRWRDERGFSSGSSHLAGRLVALKETGCLKFPAAPISPRTEFASPWVTTKLGAARWREKSFRECRRK